MTLARAETTLARAEMTLARAETTLARAETTLARAEMTLPEGETTLPTGEVDLAGAAMRVSGPLSIQVAGQLLAAARRCHFTTQATAMAAMPSSLPTKPMRSLVVALTPT